MGRPEHWVFVDLGENDILARSELSKKAVIRKPSACQGSHLIRLDDPARVSAVVHLTFGSRR
jgi:hypothetical protein